MMKLLVFLLGIGVIYAQIVDLIGLCPPGQIIDLPASTFNGSAFTVIICVNCSANTFGTNGLQCFPCPACFFPLCNTTRTSAPGSSFCDYDGIIYCPEPGFIPGPLIIPENETAYYASCIKCAANTFESGETCYPCPFGSESLSGSSSCTPIITCVNDTECVSLNTACSVGMCITGKCMSMPSGVSKCRNASGPCELDGYCDGISTTCPSTIEYYSNATRCRESAGVCDEEEFCTGSTSECPTDQFKPNATLCRGSGPTEIECDIREYCDGVSSECPPDLVRPNGTNCYDALVGFACNLQDTCDGVTKICVPRLQPNGTICAPALGACGIDVLCDGVSPSCFSPGPQVLPANTTCREASGDCDLPGLCNGVDTYCPPNLHKPANTTCRPTAGFCDIEEKCTGSDSACPVDSFKESSTVCRSSEGVCDLDEFCSGSDALCPEDSKNEDTFICRPRVTQTDGSSCDLDEYCNGVDDDCPPDLYAPVDTVCRTKQDACDLVDKCNGSSVLCHSNRKDYGYAYKCGNDYYFCTSSPTDVILRNQKNVIFGGVVMGGVVTRSVFYNLSAVVPYPGCTTTCPSRKCPNGKDMSNFVDALCTQPSGVLVAKQKLTFSEPYTSSPVCPDWVSTLNTQQFPVAPFGSKSNEGGKQLTTEFILVVAVLLFIQLM